MQPVSPLVLPELRHELPLDELSKESKMKTQKQEAQKEIDALVDDLHGDRDTVERHMHRMYLLGKRHGKEVAAKEIDHWKKEAEGFKKEWQLVLDREARAEYDR